MSKFFEKSLPLFLTVVLLFCVLWLPGVIHTSALNGQVNADHVNIRQGPSTATPSLGKVDYVGVEVLGSENGADGYVWYHIQYGTIDGYIRSDYVTIQQQTGGETNVGDFNQQLAAFPESYRAALTALHGIYPNWRFEVNQLSTTFEAALAEECKGVRKLVQWNDPISLRSMSSSLYNWDTGTWSKTSGDWTAASREIIAYYMDPRNFLDQQSIFQFLKQSYDPNTQTADGVAQVVAGTFLANGYSDPNDTAYGGSYVNVIMEAARQSGVSPYVLAATIILEQGTAGTSDLISGTTSYGSCYNFFNINASGTDVVGSGLQYANSQGWHTRSASIIGGAKFYADKYIAIGQDTYFYKDYNVINGDYNHQYAQSVYDARSSSVRLRNIYIGNTAAALTFRIPVYTNMPATAAPRPVENSQKNNYYFTDISANGLNPSFSMFRYNYSLHVTGDAAVSVTVPAGAAYVSASSFPLQAGQNQVVLTVRSETGYDNNYVLSVQADAPGTLTVLKDGQSLPTVTVKRGDTNGDGAIDVIDLAAIRLHLLGIRALQGDAFSGGDTNGDGSIDVIDLAAIRLHLLGIRLMG